MACSSRSSHSRCIALVSAALINLGLHAVIIRLLDRD
jgi:hypothetical protein